MSIDLDEVVGLCEDCASRYRRVFEPGNTADYSDEEGNLLSEYAYNDIDTVADTIIIIDMCLLTDISMGKDVTRECSHYAPINKQDTKLFKHLK